MLDEIRHEREALESIPSWEWEPEYDDILSNLSRERMRILYGGDER